MVWEYHVSEVSKTSLFESLPLILFLHSSIDAWMMSVIQQYLYLRLPYRSDGTYVCSGASVPVTFSIYLCKSEGISLDFRIKIHDSLSIAF
jgi:hypothetical protein